MLNLHSSSITGTAPSKTHHVLKSSPENIEICYELSSSVLNFTINSSDTLNNRFSKEMPRVLA